VWEFHDVLRPVVSGHVPGAGEVEIRWRGTIVRHKVSADYFIAVFWETVEPPHPVPKITGLPGLRQHVEITLAATAEPLAPSVRVIV
jgi:hypothetical protein